MCVCVCVCVCVFVCRREINRKILAIDCYFSTAAIPSYLA